jgi:hypothetical protein
MITPEPLKISLKPLNSIPIQETTNRDQSATNLCSNSKRYYTT